MRYTHLNKNLPAGNPIANILVIIAGALVIGVSIVLGFFAFVALSAIVLVSAAVIGIRVWWLNRKLRAQAHPGTTSTQRESPASVEVIEGEYQVIPDDRDEA